jgi:hypothetical protein
MRKLIAATCTSVLLMAGFTGAAAAQVDQDGLVNVAIGDIVIQDIKVNVAANVLANICANVDADVIVAVLAEVDVTGVPNTEQTCDLAGRRADQTIVITNN